MGETPGQLATMDHTSGHPRCNYNSTMAVAPTHHILFFVVLGRNGPGMAFSWSMGKEDKVVAASEGSKKAAVTSTSRECQVARERVSHGVEERARTLDPATPEVKVQEPHQVQQCQMTSQEDEEKLMNGRCPKSESGLEGRPDSKLEREKLAAKTQSVLHLQIWKAQLPPPQIQLPSCQNMEMSLQTDLEKIATAVALAVETRASNCRSSMLTKKLKNPQVFT